MSVAVIIPWQAGNEQRTANVIWLHKRFRANYPNWKIVYGYDPRPDLAFSRTRSILDGAAKTNADVLVISDADVWTDGIGEAVAVGVPWAIPHRYIHRLSEESTAKVLDGEDWHGLELSHDNPQDSQPYVGHEAGTLLVVSRKAFELAPPDPRFSGWGSEDQAWADALHVMCGDPWRGSADLLHLWHPSQPRLDRVTGNFDNAELANRYRRIRESRNRVGGMMEIIAEGIVFGLE